MLSSRWMTAATLAVVALVAVGCGGKVLVDSSSSSGVGGAGGAGGAGHGSGTVGSTSSVGQTVGVGPATTGVGTSVSSTAVVGSSVASTGTGSNCDPSSCMAPMECCNGVCVAPYNDIFNCGGCGNVCVAPDGAQAYCDHGMCTSPPCSGGPVCDPPGYCCGSMCCGPGQLCCDVPSGVETGPRCTDPVNGTCPQGCPWCD